MIEGRKAGKRDSMTIWTTEALTPELKRAWEELRGDLHVQFSVAGKKILAEEIDAGFTLSFGEEVKIGYATTVDFCRALSYLSAERDRQERCAFAKFGVMCDMSRNGVMTVAACKEYIRHLALMGYNRFMLYIEDIYEVPEEPYFGQYRGRYTAEEIREIEAYCDIFGIELVPCIQTLAHLNAPFKWWWYAQIRDCDDILLLEEPMTYEFLDHCLGAISRMFRSREVNVGMDEAFRMGLGKYYERHGAPDRMKIFCEHVQKVIDICTKYGLKPSMWSDMFYKIAYGGLHYDTERDLDPEQAKEIPKGVKLVYWDYSQADQKIYDKILKGHLAFGNETAFAGGAFTACGTVPFNKHSINATIPAFRACVDNGIQDVFVTQWGDNGAEASRYSVIPAMQVWAQLAYGQPVDAETLEERTRATHNASYADLMLLDTPAETYLPDPEECRRLHQNAAPLNSNFKFYLFNDPLLGLFDSLSDKKYAAHYRECEANLRRAGRNNPQYRYVFDHMANLCSVLELKADLGMQMKLAYDRKDRAALAKYAGEILPELLRRFRMLYRSARRQWDREHKIFGWEVQDIRFASIIQRLVEAKRRLEDYLSGKVAVLEELEQPRIPFTGAPEDTDAKKHTINTFWNTMPTTGIL